MNKRTIRARRSSAEWTALMEDWKESGLSQTGFAEREGVNIGTFKWWACRLGHVNGRVVESESAKVVSADRATFVPVRVRGTADRHAASESLRAEPASSGVEIVLANGRRVRCDLAHVDDPRLTALLRLAEGGRTC